MIEVSNKIRFYFGNIFGYLIYLLLGKKILLNKINKTKILSIYFHNPSVSVFEKIIKWLVKYDFTIVSINQLQQILDGTKVNTNKTVFISFDDAWSENLKLIPILEKYNVPITLFVPTKAIEDGDLWLNIVRNGYSKIDESIKRGFSLKDLKNISYKYRQELYLATKNKSIITRRIMTKNELIKFSKYASIGSHTVNHPILSNCNNEQVKFELENSEKTLNDWGLEINRSFAYPNGSYNNKIIDIIKESNYKYAFTTQPQFVDLSKNEFNYEVPRICIPDNLGEYENLARMSTLWINILK